MEATERLGWATGQVEASGQKSAFRRASDPAGTQLSMPVLAIGGEKSLGEALGQQMKLVARDVTVIVLKDTGHWLLEERPKETTEALVRFL